MAEYVICYFPWDRHGVPFPLSPLPKAFQALCPSYELAGAEEATEDYEIPEFPQSRRCGCMVAVSSKPGSGRGRHQRKGDGRSCEGVLFLVLEESLMSASSLPEDFHTLCPRFSLPEAEGAAADFELPEMVQATFYAMLLNEVVELGVIRGFMVEGLKLALVGLRWSSFEGSAASAAGRCSGGPCTEQAAEYFRDHFRWSLRDPTDPGSRPLPSDYHILCPYFDLEVARRYAYDSHIPEMVPGEDDLLSFFRNTVQAAEYVRDNLCWYKRETSSFRPNLLPWNFSAYYPEFNHILEMQFTDATHIPEMVQATFYAMVISDVTRLRLIKRKIGESLTSDLRKLRCDAVEAWLLSIEDKLKDARQ
ncbi:hypothetical protein Cgig2_006533 [Carnegiea gigantea]|uniref:Uncharacterized protein n=1 Tax=Carnegiea gigantea TaxID=171969 RepID=A0A9Q1JNC8_9CARY|nr:hypothetical protein Cgig2_006533 [Carnegiea gigantea]